MKIISKFSDYYDSAAQFGIDTTQIFVRKNEVIDSQNALALYEETIKNAPNKNRHYFYDRDNWSADFILIGFCGKIYPVYRLYRDRSYPNKSIERYCYSIDDVVAFFTEHDPNYLTSKKWLRKLSSKERDDKRYCFSHQVVSELFETLTGKDTRQDLFHEFHEPAWAILPETTAQRDFKGYALTLNPVLKDLKFMRVMDPFTAHQEISQYYFGVLGIKEDAGVSIDDKYRIAARGFDTRYGFRTRPKDK